MLTITEIKKSVCGSDEKGNPNVVISLSLDNWKVTENGGEKNNEITIGTSEPVIEIEDRGNYTQIDIEFDNVESNGLDQVWNVFNLYGKHLNESLEKEDGTVPTLSMTMVPIEHKDEYYILAADPLLWVITPKKVGGEPKTIRILFNKKDVQYFGVAPKTEENNGN